MKAIYLLFLLSTIVSCGTDDPPVAAAASADSDSSSTVNNDNRLALGSWHSCALSPSGAVRCWGDYGNGRLGYGNAVSEDIGDTEDPSSVGDVTIGGVVTQISSHTNHTCALLSTGSVRCWGTGNVGRLGNGTGDDIGDNETPSDAGDVNFGAGLTATQVVTGDTHTCVLLSTGNVRCWGYSFYGQLGYGNQDTIGDNELPSTVGDVDLGGVTVVQLAAGRQHTCALTSTGTVRCWGRSNYGQLGYGNTDNIGDNETPSLVGDVSIGETVTEIIAGGYHTCALLTSGNVRCWGYSFSGQLGYGNTDNIGDTELPSTVGDVPIGETVTQLAAGTVHTCALLSTGNVRCWGDAADGKIGYGNETDIGDTEDPSTAGDVSLGDTVTEIATGSDHTCALLTAGGIRCWGVGLNGRLGYGDNTNDIGDGEVPSSLAADVDVF